MAQPDNDRYGDSSAVVASVFGKVGAAMENMKKHKSKIIIGLVALLVAFITGREFQAQHIPELIVIGPGVTEVRMLSDWYPGLRGTRGDTEVYILRGDESGGSMLVLGGVHPSEPASLMSAVLLIENARPTRGTLYVIPRSNRSAFTHNSPQEGHPSSFSFQRPDGSTRQFRYGSRLANPLDQWPDPNIHVHYQSGLRRSGAETRNLNRGFPGRAGGTFTERIAYGITQLIRSEEITITIDIHEASPEYPVNNAMVAHNRAMRLAANVVLGLEMQDIAMALEPSPVNLRGLTHRELGDYTNTFVVLLESPNPAQGRLRGRTDEALVLTGQCHFYVQAEGLGRLFVPFDETGYPMEDRVGRHMATIAEFAFVLSMEYPEYGIVIEGIPEHQDLLEMGIGAFLL